MRARSATTAFGAPAEIFIHRIGKHRGFIPVSSRGDIPDGGTEGYLTALPGGRSALAFQQAGIFELPLGQ